MLLPQWTSSGEVLLSKTFSLHCTSGMTRESPLVKQEADMMTPSKQVVWRASSCLLTFMSTSVDKPFKWCLSVALIFRPDVACLAVAYNINYSLLVATICFPLRRQLLCPWPTTHPHLKKKRFLFTGFRETKWDVRVWYCICVFGGRWLIVS